MMNLLMAFVSFSKVYEDWTMAPGELGGMPVTVFSAAHPPTSRKRPYIERALQVWYLGIRGMLLESVEIYLADDWNNKRLVLFTLCSCFYLYVSWYEDKPVPLI